MNKNKTAKVFGILFLALFFSFNAIKFISMENSDHPLFSSLFKMIISLAGLIILFHKRYAKYIMRQTKLEEYFFKEK